MEASGCTKTVDASTTSGEDRQAAVSTRMKVVHRQLEELDRFRQERLRAEEIDDDNEKSLTNKDALLIETNPMERAEVLANEEAGLRDRMRREDSKKVLQQYIGMQVMAEIKRRKRLSAAGKSFGDADLSGDSGDDDNSDESETTGRVSGEISVLNKEPIAAGNEFESADEAPLEAVIATGSDEATLEAVIATGNDEATPEAVIATGNDEATPEAVIATGSDEATPKGVIPTGADEAALETGIVQSSSATDEGVASQDTSAKTGDAKPPPVDTQRYDYV